MKKRRLATRPTLTKIAVGATVLTFAGSSAALAHGGGTVRGPGVDGSVIAVDGSTFTVQRGPSTMVTVTETEATTYLLTDEATVSDAAVGSAVMVKGERADDGTLTAARLHIDLARGASTTSTSSTSSTSTTAASATSPAARSTAAGVPGGGEPGRDGHGPGDERGGRRVEGTVLTNDGTTLTVETRSGTRRVATTADTVTTETRTASAGDVVVGARVRVEGTRAADGAITARSVRIDATDRPAPPAPTSGAMSTTTAAARPHDPAPRPSGPAGHAGPGPAGSPPGRGGGAPAGQAGHAEGIVASVAAGSFTVTRRDGSILTVTTSAATTFTKTVNGTVADAAVGSVIVAKGSTIGGIFTADAIHVGTSGASAQAGGDSTAGENHGGAGSVSGTVTANDGSTITVITSSGGLVTIATPSVHAVTTTVTATASDVAQGVRVKVEGTTTSPTGIAAASVRIDGSTAQPPGSNEVPRPGSGPHRGPGGARGPGGPGSASGPGR